MKHKARAASESSDSRGDLERVFLPWKKDAPLAARMRPRTIEEFVGQEHILGPGKLLRRAIEADRLGSLILWGPPGSGKTTLARVIAGVTRSHFEVLNAVLSGVKEIREVVEAARARLRPQEILSAPAAPLSSWTRSTASTRRSRTRFFPTLRTAPSPSSAPPPRTPTSR
jgi:hypothetical protein